jgi:hypothetical protein
MSNETNEAGDIKCFNVESLLHVKRIRYISESDVPCRKGTKSVVDAFKNDDYTSTWCIVEYDDYNQMQIVLVTDCRERDLISLLNFKVKNVVGGESRYIVIPEGGYHFNYEEMIAYEIKENEASDMSNRKYDAYIGKDRSGYEMIDKIDYDKLSMEESIIAYYTTDKQVTFDGNAADAYKLAESVEDERRLAKRVVDSWNHLICVAAHDGKRAVRVLNGSRDLPSDFVVEYFTKKGYDVIAEFTHPYGEESLREGWVVTVSWERGKHRDGVFTKIGMKEEL